MYAESALDLTALLKGLDFFRPDVPEQQPLSRGFEEIIGASGNPRKRAVLQKRIGFECKQILLLRCEKIRAVDREQWFACLDRLSHVIREDFLDEARYFPADMRDLRFVVCNSTDGSDFFGKRFHFGSRGFHPKIGRASCRERLCD